MPDYRLLVFDWDGTLMDSAAHIIDGVRGVASELGEQPPTAEAVREIIGLSLLEGFQQLFPQHPAERAGELAAGYRRRHFAATREAPRLFAGADAVLRELRTAGYWLAIATGKSRRGLSEALADSGLTGAAACGEDRVAAGEALFFSTRSADDAPSKPHPQMLLDILDELRVPAAEALMIGDTTHDMRMARDAGVDALAVSYGVQPLERLLHCAPNGHIDAITELPDWLAARR